MNNDRYLIVLTGPTAAGKSTVAKWLEQRNEDTTAYHSAEIRRELNLAPEETGYEFDLDDDTFVNTVSKKVYKEMRSRAGDVIDAGGSAILDGSHRLRGQRLASYHVGFDRNVPVILLVCELDDPEKAKERLAERQDRSDALAEATKFSTYKSTKKEADPVDQDPPVKRNEIGVVCYNSEQGLVRVEKDGTDSGAVNRIKNELHELANDRKTD